MQTVELVLASPTYQYELEGRVFAESYTVRVDGRRVEAARFWAPDGEILPGGRAVHFSSGHPRLGPASASLNGVPAEWVAGPVRRGVGPWVDGGYWVAS